MDHLLPSALPLTLCFFAAAETTHRERTTRCQRMATLANLAV